VDQDVTFWLDEKRQMVIYPGQPGVLAQAIPELKLVNGSYFAIPYALRPLMAAAYYNWPVPPIMTDQSYDWPIEPGKTPLPHQKLMANFTVVHSRMLNLSDPGCMKTVSTLWAMEFLKQQAKGPFRMMVVCPLTIIETTWANAIFRNFLGRLTFEVLTGTPERRLKRLEADVDIYLVNHDGIKVGAHVRRKVNPLRPTQKKIELDGFCKAVAARDDIKLIVIDEAHGFGDPRSIRSHVADMLFGTGKRPMLKQLTGTPTATAPTDAYGMAKLSNNAFGKSFTGFRLETMMKVTDFKWVPKKDGYEQARRILTPAIRFSLDEIWSEGADLPMTVQRRKVELTEDQKREMKRLRNELQVVAASGKPISAANESAARQKLIQLSLGAVYDGEHVAHLIDATPRYRELEEIVESTARKVVVFVPITSALHLVVKYLRDAWKKKQVAWKCDFINGEVKAGKERDAVIRAFVDDPDFKLVVADPQTATEGINEFVIADTVVWFGATDRAKAWIQGNARVRRPGQKYPSNCFQLVSTKLEEEIFTRLENNTSMQGMMLESIRRGDF
jgi:SNF2-related domain